MKEPSEPTAEPRARAALVACGLLLLAAAGVWWGLPLVAAARTVVMRVGTDGVPRVYGIPLANKVPREAALSVLAHSKATVQLVWQAPGSENSIHKPLTRGGATTAQLGLLRAIGKAGVTHVVLTHEAR